MAFKFNSDKTEAHRTLADAIIGGVTRDDKTGVISETEQGSVYMGNLPEGLTPELVKAKAEYDTRFLSAAHVAAAEVAADMFMTNCELQQVKGNIGYADQKGSILFNIDRSVEYRNSFAKEGDPQTITKHLVMTATVNTASGTGHGLKSLRADMSEQFAELMKK